VDSVRITVEYQDVMTVTVISGGALTANVNSAGTVESGKVEFLGQNGTKLKVVSTKNWRVRAIATVTSYPAGADDPTANAVEIKDYLGNFTPAGSPRSHRREGDAHPCRGSHGQRRFESHARRLWRRQDRHVSVHRELLYRRRYLKEQL
jgi:hypothetical protein